MSTSTQEGKVNFHSYIDSGVDPLTGTFSANILLATLVDPSFEIRLCFSPLNLKDFGFGKGWRIPVSVYNKKTKLLSLSDGRLFEVNDDLSLKNTSGDVFFEEEGSHGYRVTYRKSGIIEILEFGKSDHCPCTARLSAIGTGIRYEWGSYEDGKEIRLAAIYRINHAAEKLLSVRYEYGSVRVEIWPSFPEARLFTWECGLRAYTLTNHSLNIANHWEFLCNEFDALERITYPTGYKEAVGFQGSRVKFHLTATTFTGYHYSEELRVSSSLTLPLNDYQPLFDAPKEYIFYGFNESGTLHEKSHITFRQNSVLDGAAGLLHEALVKNNPFTRHVPGGGQITQQFDTLLDNFSGTLFSYPDCNLVTTVYEYNKYFSITKETHNGAGGEIRSATWGYDEYGRITELNSDEATQTFSYHNPGDCKSAIRSKETSKPNNYADANLTETNYVYGSYDLSCKIHDTLTVAIKAELPTYVIKGNGEQYSKRVNEINFCEYNQPSENNVDSLRPARLTSHISIKGIDDDDFFSYSSNQVERVINRQTKSNHPEIQTSSLDFNYTHTQNETTRTTTFTSHDGLTRRTANSVSKHTGLLLWEQDFSGNTSSYTRDGLGRLTKIINNEGTDFETSESYEHGLASADQRKKILGDTHGIASSLASYIIHTDSAGKKTLSGFDSLNREIEVWEYSQPPSNEWVLLQQKKYHGSKIHKTIDCGYSAGRTTSRTTITHHPNLNARVDIELDSTLSENTQIKYTQADEQQNIIHTLSFDASSIAWHSLPEAHNGWFEQPLHFEQSLQFEECSISIFPLVPVKSESFGWYEMQQLDVCGNVIRIDRYALAASSVDSHGLVLTPHSTSTQTYVADRRTSVTDELGRCTKFTYDVFDRHATTTFADGSILTKSYPAHTDKELIERITLTSGKTEYVLGEQVFDGLERMLSSTSACKRTFTYLDNDLAPQTETFPRGTLSYETIPQLGSAVKSIKSGNLHHSFSYDKQTGLLNEFEDQSGFKTTLSYGALGKPNTAVILPIKGSAVVTQSQTLSANGRCVEYTDITGNTQTRKHDGRGNITEIDDPDVFVSATYDAFSRVQSQKILDKKTHKNLIITYGYNAFGEEIKRTITPEGNNAKRIDVEQTYFKNRQLASRKVMKGGTPLRDETFSYDVRNMLSGYTCSGSELPVDAYNKAITKLELKHDSQGNMLECISHFNGGTDKATFHYNNPKVPCQLSEVTHTHADYPACIALEYDGNGCLIKNEKGQTLSYDALNRLASLKDGKDTFLYHYDPQGRLRSRSKLTERTEWFYDLGSDVPLRVTERKGKEHVRICRLAEQIAALTSEADASRLISSDRMGTPQVAYDGKVDPALTKCSPFGITDAPLATGWSGALFDEVSGYYHLGERQYSPTLMRFTTPDSWSPFDAGGINCYAYLDPVNCPDPSGHISFWGWLGIAAAVVLGIVLGVVTMGAGIAAISAFGFSIAAGMMVAGGALIAASGAVAIAAEIVRDNDPSTAKTLDWVSYGLGVAGSVLAIGAGFARGAAQTSLHAVRSGAPRIGRLARLWMREVNSQTLAIEMKPMGKALTLGSERAMYTEFKGGARYAYSTSSNMVSGVQSVGSSLFLNLFARMASTASFRLVGVTMGMEALLGLGIGGKHHSSNV
jgi:RHS repeat-associated protein